MNLSTERKAEAESFGSSGLLWLLFFLIVTALLYAGIVTYKKVTVSSIEKITAQYAQEKESIVNGSNVVKVLDFQYRIDTSKELLTKEKNIADDFVELEKDMITPGVYVSSYTYDQVAGTIELECATENYNDVARQILSFKKSPYFSNVTAGESERDLEKNKIMFTVNLTLNKKATPAER